MVSIKLLLTTTGKISETYRLFDSLEKQFDVNVSFKLIVVFVNQSNSVFDFSNYKNIKVFEIHSRNCSLSAARNLALGFKTDSFSILGFPDDDCWYPINFFSDLVNIFNNKSGYSIICTRVFDPIRNVQYGFRPIMKKHITYANFSYLPISVGIYVFNANKELLFNTNYGAGTFNVCGEETIYLAEHMKYNAKLYYNGNLMVYHEIPNDTNDIRKLLRYSYAYGKTYKFITANYSKLHFIGFLYFCIILFSSIVNSLINFDGNIKFKFHRFISFILGFLNFQSNIK
jgi:hypothetical protein